MLFKNTILVSQFAPIATTTNFASLSPIIGNVEEDYIIPVLGQTTYDDLNNAYIAVTDESTLSDPQKALLQKCRSAIAPLVALNFLPGAEVKLSDAGAQRIETASNKTAYQNQVNNFRIQMLNDHDRAIERLYKFLEANKADYPDWQTSDEFINYRSLFIKTGGEFDNNLKSSSPYRNYYGIRNYIFDVEQNLIQNLLGPDLFSTLKTIDADPAGVFTDIQSDLLVKVKKAIAFLATAKAIPFLIVLLDSDGFTVQGAARAQDDQIAKRVAAGTDSLNAYISACNREAKEWINAIEAWLVINVIQPVEVYYVTPNDTGNDCRIGSFGMF